METGQCLPRKRIIALSCDECLSGKRRREGEKEREGGREGGKGGKIEQLHHT